MTTVHVACAQCGNFKLTTDFELLMRNDAEESSDCPVFDLTTADFKLRVCNDTNERTYSFNCPFCGKLIEERAVRWVFEKLVAAGITCETWDPPPRELPEPPSLEQRLTDDDVVEFCELLADESRFQAHLEEELFD